MPILNQIDEDLKRALKSSDKRRTSTLRLLKAALKNKQIELQRELTDEDCISVISSLIKQRKESIQQYTSAGRDDLASAEKEEFDILMSYMPPELSEEELDKIIIEVIKEVGAEGIKDLGRVMRVLMPRVKGSADGALVNKKVRILLEKG